MSEEVWKDIPGYEGAYQVSTLGRVRNPRTGRVLKQGTHRLGYKVAYLSRDSKAKSVLVHRLVAFAFVPATGGFEVNHLNLNKADNRAVNLEWTTRKGNMAHAYAAGALHQNDNRGEKHGLSKLTEQDVRAIRTRAKTETQDAIAKSLGVSRRTVGMVLSGQRWGHVA